MPRNQGLPITRLPASDTAIDIGAVQREANNVAYLRSLSDERRRMGARQAASTRRFAIGAAIIWLGIMLTWALAR